MAAPEAPGVAARRAAFDILRAVRAGRPFDDALGRAVAGLAPDDRRLAHEIAAGVLRGRTALDAALTPLVRAAWDTVQADLQDILRIGAYQLLHLRVPDYAAVQNTVELAKREMGPKPAGLVNAVLRRLGGTAGGRAGGRYGGKEIAERATALPPYRPTPADLATQYSHPEWLVARWLEEFGPERTEKLLIHNNTPPAVTLRPIRWTPERLADELARAGVAAGPVPLGPGCAVRGVRIEELPGYTDGAFIVQDPAQARVLEHAATLPGARVWDACAAPGGKSAVLARTASVTASDRSVDRLGRLRDTLRRAAPTVPVLVADARQPPFGPVFDVVLVDAPCSATGSLAKHPDARWRLAPDDVERLARLQASILDAASETVRPGGRLVYITCSLEREENEAQVDAFLGRHADWARDTPDLRIFPADAGTDGAFAARLVRRG